MSSVLVLSEASMFTREQLGTGTGKGLASALSVTASARKVQNRDKEKQIRGWEMDSGLFWWLLNHSGEWQSGGHMCNSAPTFYLTVILYFSSLSSHHFCIFNFQIIFVFLLKFCFYNS